MNTGAVTNCAVPVLLVGLVNTALLVQPQLMRAVLVPAVKQVAPTVSRKYSMRVAPAAKSGKTTGLLLLTRVGVA